jgi:hypothetical protein
LFNLLLQTLIMEEFRNERERSQKSYRLFRTIYDLSMAALILGSGILMLGAKWFKVDQVLNIDSDFRMIFGFMCLAYGGFRLYRGFKQSY